MKIWDRFGRLIGTTKSLPNGDHNTYDEHGQPLGKVQKLGTFDKNGQKTSSTRDAVLTFCKRASSKSSAERPTRSQISNTN
jgi:hypothetical protein